MSLYDELIAEGIEKGEKQGIEKGIEKGMKVIKLWQQGVKTNLIANVVDLSLEQVNKIISDFQSNV